MIESIIVVGRVLTIRWTNSAPLSLTAPDAATAHLWAAWTLRDSR